MSKPKVIAIYLPQFHQIKENDMWWGEGFTEWTNVKKAQPLYEGHNQPRVPYMENYYDLSNRNVLIDQMLLANEYMIDGFCFYHYWFKGRKLLEKPLEALLENKSLPLKFMLSWANEPWTRTWDGDNGAKSVLMPQDYGDKRDWIEHYKYLSQFFMRNEYIKIDGRPVMVLYNPGEIQCRREMLSAWNEEAKKDGFSDGLFIVNTHRLPVEREIPSYGDALFDFEPLITVSDRFTYTKKKSVIKDHFGNRLDNKQEVYHVVDYGKLCELMISREAIKKAHHYLGFFTGWDNTPRRGLKPQLVIDGNTPNVVTHYFDIQYRRSIEAENEFLFINAWNEWGEGAVLEADDKFEYGYIEGIKKVIKNY